MFFYLEALAWEVTVNRERVSVPRRGFIVFLPKAREVLADVGLTTFQSPEGDSLFFY